MTSKTDTQLLVECLDRLHVLTEALDMISKIKPGDPIDAAAIARDVLRKETDK